MPNPIINRRLVSSRLALPQRAQVVLLLESADFDNSANGSTVTVWNDHSGKGFNFNLSGASLLGSPAVPTVSGSVLCNGHKTIRFDGTMCIGTNAAPFDTASLGVEQMIVFVNDADPPTNVPAGANGAFFNMLLPGSGGTFGCLQPFTDGNFYESFGRSDRPSLGNPTTTTAGAFCCYDVVSKADGSLYSAWINSENFFTTGSGYTFNKTNSANSGETRLGGVYTGVTNLFGKGNVAAVYGWTTFLTTAERLQARAYISKLWAIPF